MHETLKYTRLQLVFGVDSSSSTQSSSGEPATRAASAGTEGWRFFAAFSDQKNASGPRPFISHPWIACSTPGPVPIDVPQARVLVHILFTIDERVWSGTWPSSTRCAAHTLASLPPGSSPSRSPPPYPPPPEPLLSQRASASSRTLTRKHVARSLPLATLRLPFTLTLTLTRHV